MIAAFPFFETQLFLFVCVFCVVAVSSSIYNLKKKFTKVFCVCKKLNKDGVCYDATSATKMCMFSLISDCCTIDEKFAQEHQNLNRYTYS